jgi:dipeptidyl aminopeptidase/acylaminoacyl peptidase
MTQTTAPPTSNITLRLLSGLLFIALALSACSGLAKPPASEAQAVLPGSTLPAPLARTATLEPTAGATHTATPPPTDTSTATLTATPTPTLHPMQIAAMRAVEYPGSDLVIEETLDPGNNYERYYVHYLSEGLKIYALLTVPRGEMPPTGWPVIVFNHGYIPPTVYRTTERYIAYVDNLARSGYIVLRVDYRGHDRSEGEPTGAYGDPGYTVDVLNAVATMRRFPGADPERIGMWGHSMGGYITLRAMVIDPGIKVGVIWAGVVANYPDMLTRWRRARAFPTSTPNPTGVTRRWRQDLTELYGTPEENPEFWASISANSYLADLNGRPIQLHHGTSDADVPLEFSQTLAEQMQVAGQTVELYTYEGDDHNISNYFTAAMTHTIVFYDTYLKP